MLQDTPALLLTSTPLPYYIEAGYVVSEPGYQHPNRRSIGVYDLIAVESGVLHLGEESHRWSIGPGQLVVLHPDRHHYPVLPCQVETRFYWLHFQTSPMQESTPPSAYTIRLPQFWSLPSPERTFRRFRKLLELATARRSEAFWEEQGVFLELLQELDEARWKREASRTLIVAEQAEAYLRQNYRSRITNARLSQDLHYHHNYLTRCMKEIYGRSPLEYLLQLRLEQAKLLLIKTDLSVAHVALEVGFEYASHFTRCFKAWAGQSPLQFRKQYMHE